MRTGPSSGSVDTRAKANRVRRMLKFKRNRSSRSSYKDKRWRQRHTKHKNHFNYISRNGKLELEDQDGNIIRGREEIGSSRRMEIWQVWNIHQHKKEAFKLFCQCHPGRTGKQYERPRVSLHKMNSGRIINTFLYRTRMRNTPTFMCA